MQEKVMTETLRILRRYRMGEASLAMRGRGLYGTLPCCPRTVTGSIGHKCTVGMVD